MPHNDVQTLINFIQTQQPETVFLIPEETAQGRAIDVTDSQAIADARASGHLPQMALRDALMDQVNFADEQHDAGGLIVVTPQQRYLILYAAQKEGAQFTAGRGPRDA